MNTGLLIIILVIVILVLVVVLYNFYKVNSYLITAIFNSSQKRDDKYAMSKGILETGSDLKELKFEIQKLKEKNKSLRDKLNECLSKKYASLMLPSKSLSHEMLSPDFDSFLKSVVAFDKLYFNKYYPKEIRMGFSIDLSKLIEIVPQTMFQDIQESDIIEKVIEIGRESILEKLVCPSNEKDGIFVLDERKNHISSILRSMLNYLKDQKDKMYIVLKFRDIHTDEFTFRSASCSEDMELANENPLLLPILYFMIYLYKFKNKEL